MAKKAKKTGKKKSSGRSPSKPKKPKEEKPFPYREEDEAALRHGHKVAKGRYEHEIRSTAIDILEDFADEHEDLDDAMNRGSILQRVDEEADRAVVFTADAKNILLYSDNWTAAEEEVDLRDICDGGISPLITKIAYFAYHEDLMDMIAAHADEVKWRGNEDQED